MACRLSISNLSIKGPDTNRETDTTSRNQPGLKTGFDDHLFSGRLDNDRTSVTLWYLISCTSQFPVCE